jgi:poly-gamma-glutamate synthesis protein (capsule biosynthesis protein)
MARDSVDVVAVGDVFLNREDPASAFRHTRDLFGAADVRMGNLEASLVGGSPAQFRSLCIRMPPGAASALGDVGFDAMSFANNHAMDWGPDALRETVELMETEGVAVAGAGADLAAAERVVTVDADGVSVGVVAFEATHASFYFTMQADARRAGMNMVPVSPLFPAPHVGQSGLERIDRVVGDAAAAVDVLFVLCHFGELLTHDLTTTQRAVARRAVDAGADAVVGTHPHVLQAVEVYRGAPICYSLGHFVFDSIKEFGLEYLDAVFPERSDDTAIARFEVSESGLEALDLHPTYLGTDGNPRLAAPDGDRYDAIADTLVSLSAQEDTALRRERDALVVPV